jgi:aminopeptidase N
MRIARRPDEAASGNCSHVLSLQYEEDVFSFVNMATRPVPSLGRDFSAPVIIDYDYSEADLLHLLSFDSDPFNRWEAGQRLALNLLLKGITVHQRGGQAQFPDSLAVAFGRVLADGADDPAFAAEVLVLPTEMYIGRTNVRHRPCRHSPRPLGDAALSGGTPAKQSAANISGNDGDWILLPRRGFIRSARAPQSVPGLPDGSRRD